MVGGMRPIALACIALVAAFASTGVFLPRSATYAVELPVYLEGRFDGGPEETYYTGLFATRDRSRVELSTPATGNARTYIRRGGQMLLLDAPENRFARRTVETESPPAPSLAVGAMLGPVPVPDMDAFVVWLAGEASVIGDGGLLLGRSTALVQVGSPGMAEADRCRTEPADEVLCGPGVRALYWLAPDEMVVRSRLQPGNPDGGVTAELTSIDFPGSVDDSEFSLDPPDGWDEWRPEDAVVPPR